MTIRCLEAWWPRCWRGSVGDDQLTYPVPSDESPWSHLRPNHLLETDPSDPHGWFPLYQMLNRSIIALGGQTLCQPVQVQNRQIEIILIYNRDTGLPLRSISSRFFFTGCKNSKETKSLQSLVWIGTWHHFEKRWCVLGECTWRQLNDLIAFGWRRNASFQDNGRLLPRIRSK